ncbi:hemolysin family protein [Actinospongicola halichondriae]|uniref:hemolysin family protein n=1 Tax=Actinospongicola halichondriae TaxID=3236844 RepID=UPI003D4AC004
MTIALTAGAVLVLLGVIGVFSVCETVLVHLSVARATTMVDEGQTRADTLVELLHRREANLGSVLVARLAAQVGVVGLVVALGSGQELSPSVWLAVAAALVVILGVIEALAKTVALVRTDEVALRVSTLLGAVGRIPLLGLLGAAMSSFVRHRSEGIDDTERPRVSEEELLALAEVAVEAEVLETSEHALIESIIEFGDTIVREVMVPRPDMVTVESPWEISDVMEVVILNGYSRIPVIGESIDDIVGIAYAKDLMRAERDGNGDHAVGDHLRQARFVPEQQRVSSLLPEMQSEQFHMAIVIDEYGGVAGLVTLEDLIEELVGEIVDEFDVEDPMAEPLPGGAYRVNARMPLDEVNDLLGADLPEGDWDTVGGLVFGTLGHVPFEGETVELGTHRLTAARVQGRRIGMVRIDRVLDRENV